MAKVQNGQAILARIEVENTADYGNVICLVAGRRVTLDGRALEALAEKKEGK